MPRWNVSSGARPEARVSFSKGPCRRSGVCRVRVLTGPGKGIGKVYATALPRRPRAASPPWGGAAFPAALLCQTCGQGSEGYAMRVLYHHRTQGEEPESIHIG